MTNDQREIHRKKRILEYAERVREGGTNIDSLAGIGSNYLKLLNSCRSSTNLTKLRRTYLM
jgi:hypothetical protein